jgi:hypothetical protein
MLVVTAGRCSLSFISEMVEHPMKTARVNELFVASLELTDLPALQAFLEREEVEILRGVAVAVALPPTP